MPQYALNAAETAGFDIMSFLPLIGIFLIFYFLLLRPQQKKMKQHQEMLSKLKRGDRIVTNGGLMGTISKIINDNELQVEIAEGVQVRVIRSMVSNVEAKTQPQAVTGAEPKEIEAPAAPRPTQRRTPYRRKPTSRKPASAPKNPEN